MDNNFVLDLVSAVDYVCDIEIYLRECETESLPCDIEYLKNKIADVKSNLNSMMDYLYKNERQ